MLPSPSPSLSLSLFLFLSPEPLWRPSTDPPWYPDRRGYKELRRTARGAVGEGRDEGMVREERYAGRKKNKRSEPKEE